MSIVLLGAVAGLVGTGVYLATSRSLSRVVLGLSLLGHAAVLALLAAGGPAGDAPLAPAGARVANPLPQALALTAIVISFGLTVFLLGLARRQGQLAGDDLVEDDLEDRRIAAVDATDPSPTSPTPTTDAAPVAVQGSARGPAPTREPAP